MPRLRREIFKRIIFSNEAEQKALSERHCCLHIRSSALVGLERIPLWKRDRKTEGMVAINPLEGFGDVYGSIILPTLSLKTEDSCKRSANIKYLTF